jgi:hypothetical protein
MRIRTPAGAPGRCVTADPSALAISVTMIAWFFFRNLDRTGARDSCGRRVSLSRGEADKMTQSEPPKRPLRAVLREPGGVTADERADGNPGTDPKCGSQDAVAAVAALVERLGNRSTTLLIRGFGVQVPGASVLTCSFLLLAALSRGTSADEKIAAFVPRFRTFRECRSGFRFGAITQRDQRPATAVTPRSEPPTVLRTVLQEAADRAVTLRERRPGTTGADMALIGAASGIVTWLSGQYRLDLRCALSCSAHGGPRPG